MCEGKKPMQIIPYVLIQDRLSELKYNVSFQSMRDTVDACCVCNSSCISLKCGCQIICVLIFCHIGRPRLLNIAQ
jgi:hypothetical protein